jgi:hypothetical protein
MFHRAAAIALAAASALGSHSSAQVQTVDEIRAAAKHILRLPPSDFKELPAVVRADLARRGCTIPQAQSSEPRNNVVRGHFTNPTTWDWAVLCSTNGHSAILVFRGGSTRFVARLAADDDASNVSIEAGRAWYSRSLRIADAEYIRVHYEAYGGPTPPPLDHDGINDGCCECCSVVWYFYKGKWLRLTGAN